MVMKWSIYMCNIQFNDVLDTFLLHVSDYFSSVQKAGLISKEYHSCIILERIVFFWISWWFEQMSGHCAVGKPVEMLGGCSELAGTGRPGGPVGQVEGPTTLTRSAGWGLPSAQLRPTCRLTSIHYHKIADFLKTSSGNHIKPCWCKPQNQDTGRWVE